MMPSPRPCETLTSIAIQLKSSARCLLHKKTDAEQNAKWINRLAADVGLHANNHERMCEALEFIITTAPMYSMERDGSIYDARELLEDLRRGEAGE